MKRHFLCIAVVAVSSLAMGGSKNRGEHDDSYAEAIRRTAAMTADQRVGKMAAEHGLQVLNVTWEDTGRYKDSAVGPNISDMTIQVAHKTEESRDELDVTCMPVIRHPNFSDKTCDLDPHDLVLLIGNQNGKPLKRVSLQRFLKHPLRYLTDPDSWKGAHADTTLLAERDTKVLVSAQACFLPVPKKGKATFNPVLFNYQSVKGDPAVLTILATREGTSVTIIDNTRDAFGSGSVWGQRLFHNERGQRASLTGERLGDYKDREEISPRPVGIVKRVPDAALNQVLLIQVPLKQRNPMPSFAPCSPFSSVFESFEEERSENHSDVDNAVIGHGEFEGPFTEIGGVEIERDPRFPIRVTVQFYKATATGLPSSHDIAEIAHQIEKIYAHSDYAGSLVTGGKTGRITEYEGAKVQPDEWWKVFWDGYEKEHGATREEAIHRLQKLLGDDIRKQAVCELFLRDQLR